MIRKKCRYPTLKRSLSPTLGIPTFNRAEKMTEVVPVKLQISLKKIIPRPQSKWIREAIILRPREEEKRK